MTIKVKYVIFNTRQVRRVKIYLYLEDKIMNFQLPKDIEGSYSFDENPEEEAKLINISNCFFNILSNSFE